MAATRRWPLAGLAALAIGAAFGLDQDAPALIVVAALVPAVCLAMLIARLDRRRPRPLLAQLAALLWGGSVAAFAALRVNDFALRSLPQHGVAIWLAPLVEESCKGSALIAVLLLRSDAWRGVREAAICAALAGLGFAATENLGYYLLAMVQGGSPGLVRAVYLRGLLEGMNHAAFTALLGAAAGYARVRCVSRAAAVGVTLGGLGLAAAVHALWNLVMAPRVTDVLCNASQVAGPCAAAPDWVDLFLHVPALIALLLAPVLGLLVLLVRRIEAKV